MTQKTDVVVRMRKGAEVVDRQRFPMVYQTYTEGADEIERLRLDKERALAALRFVARGNYTKRGDVRYAAEIAIEELTI
jgi:hypothetical protein